MSGGYVPYRLRHNKAVDRLAFVELLRRISTTEGLVDPISTYQYVGFGGPSLEEHRLLHAILDVSHLVSLEQDPNVHNRQRFNRPYSCIDCRLTNSSEFLSEFERTKPSIFWLDYTAPRELPIQLREFDGLVRKLEAYDVAKITLNAHAPAWGTSIEGTSPLPGRLSKLQAVLGDMLPNGVAERAMSNSEFPGVVLRALEATVAGAMRSRTHLVFRPLTLFTYADGQTMLTATGILLPREREKAFVRATRINRWKLAAANWSNLLTINVPDFTAKEKLHVDSLLPKRRPQTVHKRLGFQFTEDQDASESMLDVYAKVYRFFPFFSEVRF